MPHFTVEIKMPILKNKRHSGRYSSTVIFNMVVYVNCLPKTSRKVNFSGLIIIRVFLIVQQQGLKKGANYWASGAGIITFVIIPKIDHWGVEFMKPRDDIASCVCNLHTPPFSKMADFLALKCHISTTMAHRKLLFVSNYGFRVLVSHVETFLKRLDGR